MIALPRIPSPALGLALMGAAAHFLAFANPVSRLPFMAVVLAWVLATLARGANDARQAFRHGWLTGALGASASLYWIAIPVHDYGHLPWIVAAPCPMLMGVVLGLYTGGFCWLLHRCRPGLPPVAWGLLAGTAWVALEWLRGWLFSGFPWYPLAAAFVPWPQAIQGLSVLGAYGLSGLIAALGALLAVPALAPRFVAACLLTLAVAHGLWAFARPIASQQRFNAVMVQGNIEQDAKWDPETLAVAVGKYVSLSRSAAHARPDVVIWPETALTFFVQEPSAAASQVKEFVKGFGAPLVAGAPGFEPSMGEYKLFNRAYLITDKGLADFYEKEHLVPFGEYAPFGRNLPILSVLMQGVGAFTPGVRTAPLVTGRLAMGMLICYESIFPELAQERVAQGANVLVNISNDAWFGRSSAAWQHLELAVLRAVEQNRFLLRATNTGVTALVDPKGRVSSPTDLFTEAAVTVSGVGLITEKTIYHRLHGWLEAVCALAALGLAGWAIILNKRRGDT